jgi:4-hydroxybenzoate polyprenyltransferase
VQEVLSLLRPHQYIKNGFVFLGVVFAGQWELQTLALSGLVFIAFCMMASAVYVMNDMVDVESDRLHPMKRQRPLPSGAISLRSAAWLSAGLALLALVIAATVSLYALLFLLAYALLNVGYSLQWKHIVVLDVFIIAAGFMFRIFAGTLGIGIAPSSWLLLCGLMLTLFLGFAKRRAELRVLENAGINDPVVIRKVLDNYTPLMIEQFMSISAACAILTYSLYTMSAETVARHHTEAMIYTVPFVVYGIFRYLFLLHVKGRGDDTALDLYTDPHLLVTVVAWMVTTLVVLA